MYSWREQRICAALLAAVVMALFMPTGRLSADETQPSAESAEIPIAAADAGDLQDLILLNAGRPIFLRLHIRLGGQGYQSTWGDYLWERFQELDADASGSLDNDEFNRGDWTTFAERRTRTGTTRFEQLTFLDIDTNPQDDAISFDELVEQLAQSCFGISRGGQRRPAAGGDPLFVILDHDNDKMLDKTEMTAGIDTLYRYDRDEDEAYSDFELRDDGNPFGNNFEVQNPNQPTRELLLAPVPDQPPATICEALIARYDVAPAGGKADGLLDREELRLGEQEFAAADKDANGKLDVPELSAWYQAQPPDVELEAQLDPDVKGRRVQVLNQPDAKDAHVRTEMDKDGSIMIRGMSFELDIRGNGSAKPENIEKNTRQMFKQQADQDKNDYLDKNELRRINGRAEFAKIDKDHDGKIFVDEYVEYVKRQNEIAAKRVNGLFTDRGSTLFEILDANRNNMLGMRELRLLAQTASAWDRDGDGKIKPDDIPRRYQLRLGPGGPTMNTNGTFVVAAYEANPGGPRRTGIGPEWFQRMDRNQDGDLSRREFLGTREQFQNLDADRDGLLDAKEAVALAPKK
jgi:Ca2+-binding EF-hand superfamily protein